MFRSRSRLAMRWCAVLFAFALVAAACGDDDTTSATGGDSPTSAPEGGDDSSDDGAAADGSSDDDGSGDDEAMAENTATDVGVTADTIRIGYIVTNTGDAASGHIDADKGFEARIEAVNEAGGIHGRTIEIVDVVDDGGTADGNLREFENLVNQDVFTVVGCWPVFGAAQYAVDNGIPAIGCRHDTSWAISDNVFAVPRGSWVWNDPAAGKDFTDLPVEPAQQLIDVDAYIIGKRGIDKKIGTIAYDHVGSRASAGSVCDSAPSLGIECVYNDSSLPFGFTDLGASIEVMKASGAIHYFASMDINGCVTVTRSWLRAGLDDWTLQCAVGYGQDTIDSFPDVIENIFIELESPPNENRATDPNLDEYLTEMEERKPGVEPGTTSLNGYQQALFLTDVLEALGPDVTRAGFIDFVRNDGDFSPWSPRGLGESIDWTKNQWEAYADPNATADPDKCGNWLMRPDLANNAWKQVGMLPLQCYGAMQDEASYDAFIAADTFTIEVG